MSHDGHSVWNLHIRDVERSDEGQYMCQINTARAMTRLGNLHVVGEYSVQYSTVQYSTVQYRCQIMTKVVETSDCYVDCRPHQAAKLAHLMPPPHFHYIH